jgi:hypothetical protein
MEENMKVQVPSYEEWVENKAWSDREIQNHKHDYRIFCDGIAFANEQLEQTGTGSKQLSLMDEDTLFNKYQELKNTFGSWFDAFKAGYELASVSSPLPPTKRPFLSDGDILDELIVPNDYADTFADGARWARDKYEARDGGGVPGVEPKWQPVVGDKCAFWYDETGNDKTEAGIFDFFTSEGRPSTDQHNYDHCALLETLDEIGKPPAYFIERGRATV